MSSVYNAVKAQKIAIYEAFYTILSNVLPFPVVKADETEHRPDGAHLSFKILTAFTQQGLSPEAVPVLDEFGAHTGYFAKRCFLSFTANVEAIGVPIGNNKTIESFVDAMDMAQAAALAMELQDSLSILHENGLAINRTIGPTDLSKIIETETEPRALVEFQGSSRIDIIDHAEYFTSAEFQGFFDTDYDGVTDITTDIFQI